MKNLFDCLRRRAVRRALPKPAFVHNRKLLTALPFFVVLLMAATVGNLQWTQIRSTDRHGTDSKGQSSDGTGTSGNLPKFNSGGGLTDGGGPPAQTISSVSHFFLNAYSAVTGVFGSAQPAFTDLSGSLASSQCPAGTTSAIGCLKTDASTISNTSGLISCTTATTSQIGCLKPDGTTVTISGGVISASGGGGGGSGFYTVDPAGVSGLYALYYADQGVYKDLGVTLASAGDLIEQWNDQSGNGHHLIQTTSGKRPTYQTAGGPPGLTNRTVWAGGQCLQLSSAAISTFTIFTVLRGTPGSTAGMIYEQSANAAAGSGFFMYGSTGSTILASRSAVLSARNDTTNWSIAGEWYLLNHVYRGTHATHTWGFNTVLSNGIATDGTNSSDPGSGTVTDTLNVGARNNAASIGFTGDIIAVVIFTPAISTQNIQGITNFLTNKYNI